MAGVRISGEQVSVAVKINGEPHLSKLNTNLPIEEIIHSLCEEHNLEYRKGEWGLWIDPNSLKPGNHRNTLYIGDNVALKLAQGNFLLLKESPGKIAHELLSRLANPTPQDYVALNECSEDKIILKQLHVYAVHRVVYKLLLTDTNELNWLWSLNFIYRLLDRHLITSIPNSIQGKLVSFVKHVLDKESDPRFVIQSLSILCYLRKNGRFSTEPTIFEYLSYCILQSVPEVRTLALKLINFMVLYPYDAEDEKLVMDKAVNKTMVGLICDKLVKPAENMKARLSESPVHSKEKVQAFRDLAHQLYRYQTLLLRPYWHAKMMRVLNNDPSVVEFRKLSKEVKKWTLPERRFNEDHKKLHRISSLLENQKIMFGSRTTRASLDDLDDEVRVSRDEDLTDVDTNGRISMRRLLSCVPDCKDDQPTKPPERALSISFQFDGKVDMKQLAPLHDDLIDSRKWSSGPNLSAVEVKDPMLSLKANSQASINNLGYQAVNYKSEHVVWDARKGQKMRFAERMTQIACQVLGVGRTRDMDTVFIEYNPLIFFAYPYVLEEVFCAVAAIYDRVAKEMKARYSDDEPKVFSVIKEMLKGAMQVEPCSATRFPKAQLEPVCSVQQLRHNLEIISYKDIQVKRRTDHEAEVKKRLQENKLFLDFRDQRTPAIIRLIEDQRKDFVTKGQHLFQFEPETVTERNSWENKCHRVQLSLNKKGDQLQLGKCASKYSDMSDCKQVHVDFKLPLDELKDISVGARSRGYVTSVTNHTKWSFNMENYLFTLHMENGSFYSFIIAPSKNKDRPSLRYIDYWVDGLNLIRGKPMNSNTMNKELKDFLDMEVRLQFLDVEGIQIPDEEPAVPPLPPNFDFNVKEKAPIRVRTTIIDTPADSSLRTVDLRRTSRLSSAC